MLSSFHVNNIKYNHFLSLYFKLDKIVKSNYFRSSIDIFTMMHSGDFLSWATLLSFKFHRVAHPIQDDMLTQETTKMLKFLLNISITLKCSSMPLCRHPIQDTQEVIITLAVLALVFQQEKFGLLIFLPLELSKCP